MKKIIFIIIILLASLFLYGRYIEVNNFKIKEYTIVNAEIPDSFKDLKIVHFSDLLYTSKDSENILDNVTEEINNLNADIIIFSGDLFKTEEKYSDADYEKIKNNLKKMEASLYKFAIIGDNDKSNLNKYKDILYESDFKLLDNENMLLFYKDASPINIIGLTNLDNINELLVTDIPYSYSIAITHEPDDLEDISKLNINTILSGHSLGGIINVPFYGGIIKKDGANKYINEYHKFNNTEIFISNGLGYEKFNFRLFNTPSINVYRFSK